jgi:hypothetical protein
LLKNGSNFFVTVIPLFITSNEHQIFLSFLGEEAKRAQTDQIKLIKK